MITATNFPPDFDFGNEQFWEARENIANWLEIDTEMN